MNLTEDRLVGILYLPTMFKLDRCSDNLNLYIIGQTQKELTKTYKHTHTHTHRYIQTETDTLPQNKIGSRKNGDLLSDRQIDTHFNRVQASAVRKSSKSGHPFDWNFKH